MAKRVSLAISLTLIAGFVVGAGCSSIPDHRKVIGSGKDGGGDGGGGTVDGGETGGTGAGGSGNTGGLGTGNRGGGGTTSTGGTGAGGRGAGGGAQGGSGGKITIIVDGGPEGGILGIPCGKNACTDRVVGRTTYAACCAGARGDRCGLDTSINPDLAMTGCVEPNQPGTLDSVCKDIPSPDDSSVTLYYGCCRPDGKCGIFYDVSSGPNFGCINPTDIGLPAGKDCTPAPCAAGGEACQANSDCCAGPAGDPVCATLKLNAGKSLCTDFCVTNRDCPSGCCVQLITGRGACAPAAGCSADCRKEDETCDSDADCCAPDVCAPTVPFGPRLCRPRCNTNAICMPEFCVKDEAGRGTCSSTGSGLCSDDCRYANDGYCDDSGTVGDGYACALGTDCTDCKTPRLGGISRCFDSCATKNNGKCEDGGTGSVASTCEYGTDCTDCKKARLGICTNSCQYAYDGYCDDGGPGSGSPSCSPGTDCADCGPRFDAARGQGVCDGTRGTDCFPHGGVLNYEIEDGTCQCPDCSWDAVDCKVTTNKCDGVTLGACCAPNNPCKIQFDGVCACGGWCDWETPDCGRTTPTPYCDGSDFAGACVYPMPTGSTLKGNNKCDCGGACSWEQADCTKLGTLCADSCKSANNGKCDDDDVVCPYGTDCADCGPRYPH